MPTPPRAPRPRRRSRPTTLARLAPAVALLAAGALAGCAPGGAEGPASSSTGAASGTLPPLPTVQRVTPALSTSAPRGATITVPAAPQRIVCLTGICDDITASLGITPVATATPRLAASPVEFGDAGKAIPVVPGSFGSEDVGAIAAYKPDLVIGLARVHDSLAPAIGRALRPAGVGLVPGAHAVADGLAPAGRTLAAAAGRAPGRRPDLRSRPAGARGVPAVRDPRGGLDGAARARRRRTGDGRRARLAC